MDDKGLIECMAYAAAEEAVRLSPKGITWENMSADQKDFACAMMRVGLRVSRSESDQVNILLQRCLEKTPREPSPVSSE